MQIIRWIHFSDLHLGYDAAVDTRLMRRNLPSYIASLNQSFDYAFCTGDVKNWSADYSTAPAFLSSLCRASKTPLEHLFIVPGNHDVIVGDASREELIERLTDWNKDYYASVDGTIKDGDMRLLLSGETAFVNFIKTLLGSDRADKYSAPHFVITTEHLNVLHVDSTLTYGKGRDRDFVIGTRSLMDALDKCDPVKPTILLTHYSFDFLEQQERNEVETLLDNYHVQLWLAGHEHDNLIRKQRDKFWECQCGNLALQKGARSCFIVGEYDIDTGDGILTVHAWYPSRGWERYPFARTGAEDNSFYPFTLGLPGDNRVSDVSAELVNAREAYNTLSSAGNIFSGVHINPEILTDLEWNGHLFKNDNQNFPLDTIISKLWADIEKNPGYSCNALILGDGGMGKSTTMFHECGRLLEKQRLAIYISLQARESTENESIKEYVLRCLCKNIDERARNKLIQLTASRHTHPDLVLFIDGFNELTGAGAQRYVSEIKELSQYPGIQIIISSRLDFYGIMD